jgi:hypothetical protein
MVTVDGHPNARASLVVRRRRLVVEPVIEGGVSTSESRNLVPASVDALQADCFHG